MFDKIGRLYRPLDSRYDSSPNLELGSREHKREGVSFSQETRASPGDVGKLGRGIIHARLIEKRFPRPREFRWNS